MSDTASQLRYADWKEVEGAETPLETTPDTTQQWSIKFDILLGSWIIGSDEGVLWFDDQHLYVLGKLTSFAIPGHRISEKFEKRITAVRPFERQLCIPLNVDSPAPLSVQLDIVVTPPFVPENIALMDSLRACRNHSDPMQEGQLPPVHAWKNAQSVTQLLRLQSRSVFRIVMASLFSGAVVAFVMRDFMLNGLLGFALFLIAEVQIYRWMSPKLFAVNRAIQSYRSYAAQAQAPDLSGEPAIA